MTEIKWRQSIREMIDSSGLEIEDWALSHGTTRPTVHNWLYQPSLEPGLEIAWCVARYAGARLDCMLMGDPFAERLASGPPSAIRFEDSMRARLKTLGMTLRDLSHESCVHYSTIHRWKHGVLPGTYRALKIATALGSSLHDMCRGPEHV